MKEDDAQPDIRVLEQFKTGRLQSVARHVSLFRDRRCDRYDTKDSLPKATARFIQRGEGDRLSKVVNSNAVVLQCLYFFVR